MKTLNDILHRGDDSFKCDYCKDSWCEACEDLMIFKQGIFKCNCICNTEVIILN
jgi:hypothetical protein